jgi:hypothetical protein
MEADFLEMLAYVIAIGVLPYVVVEASEMLQRIIARRRHCSRH